MRGTIHPAGTVTATLICVLIALQLLPASCTCGSPLEITGSGETSALTGPLPGKICFFPLEAEVGVPGGSGPSNVADSAVTCDTLDLENMVLVPPGTFIMGDGEIYCGKDIHQVTLTRAFYLGRYEVTNQEYRDLLQWAYDHGYVTATATSVLDNMDGSTIELMNLDGNGCQIAFSGSTFTVESGKEDHPVIQISWCGAAAYCDWLSMLRGLPRAYDHATWRCNGENPYGAIGYRLPTDAEWEYAAQYDDGRPYPWGNEPPDSGRANFYESRAGGSSSVVGSYPAAPASLGLYDMAGNVWEWCNDWHTCNLGSGPVSDPVGPSTGSYRVLRGGGWYSRESSLRRAARHRIYVLMMSNATGFRYARSQ